MSMIAAVLIAAAAAAGTPVVGPAGTTLASRTVRAARREGPITLDGKLDEPAWQAAELGQGFTQIEPEEGKPSPLQTRFRVLWDEQYLYVGIECDDPEPLTAYLSRRDREVEGDRIDVDIETTLDRRTAYHFGVYAAGQQVDKLHYNDTDGTADWDAVWESAVARGEHGWSVELKIPLRSMRIPEHAREFGLQIARVVSRRHEESWWNFQYKDTPGYVSTKMGTLTGIEGIHPVRQLELRPYVGARAVRTVPAPGDIASPARLDACPSIGVTRVGIVAGCAGLDLRYGLSSDLSLVATVNPDFGQVEADQRVLNLSTFETFFPEKRPFFLEGLDLFKPPVRADFGGAYGGDAFQLFYSRRIGRPPPIPTDASGNNLTPLYEPAARPVAEALKLSGSIGAATVSVLSALEPRVSAQMEDAGPPAAAFERRVAEAVHSAAARVRVPLGDSALLGFTGTAVDPLFSSGVDGSRHAHTGGADLILFDKDRDWNLQTQVAGSLLNGGPVDTQRDGTQLKDGSAGMAASLKVSREGGSLIAFLQTDYLSPQFTSNDLGFMRRANLERTVFFMNWRDVHPNATRQFARLGCGGRHVRNAAYDTPLETDFGCEGNVTLNSFWYFGGGVYGGPHGYDDRELLDGTPFERPGSVFAYGFVGSDTRRDVFAELDMLYQHGVNGRFTDVANPSFTLRVRPMPQLETQLDMGVTVTRGDVRAIRAATLPGSTATLDQATATEVERVYLFAPQDSRSVSATLRGTFAFSPTLTLQAYAQLFAAGVAYHAPLRAQVGPGKSRIRLDDLSPALDTDGAPDNSDDRQAGVNVNLILRWEWALGSTFYLVYAHTSSNEFMPRPRGLDLSGELSTAWQGGATHGDTLLVKIDLLKAL